MITDQEKFAKRGQKQLKLNTFDMRLYTRIPLSLQDTSSMACTGRSRESLCPGACPRTTPLQYRASCSPPWPRTSRWWDPLPTLTTRSGPSPACISVILHSFHNWNNTPLTHFNCCYWSLDTCIENSLSLILWWLHVQ